MDKPINNLPNMKLYWSSDMVFQNTFISSIMSRNRFLQIFYNLHLADNSLEPKRGSREYSKIYKVKILLKFYEEISKKVITLQALPRKIKGDEEIQSTVRKQWKITISFHMESIVSVKEYRAIISIASLKEIGCEYLFIF